MVSGINQGYIIGPTACTMEVNDLVYRSRTLLVKVVLTVVHDLVSVAEVRPCWISCFGKMCC